MDGSNLARGFPGSGSLEVNMGWDRLRWYRAGRSRLRVSAGEGLEGHDGPRPELPRVTPNLHRRLANHYVGALVARSQIRVSGSTVTLMGTLTNETGCYVYFTGAPPYAVSLDAEGTETILLGDFNPQPRDSPSTGDCVMHPGATIPYRSIPVTVRTPDPEWDGQVWCVSSRSTALDKTFYNQLEVPTIQLFE